MAYTFSMHRIVSPAVKQMEELWSNIHLVRPNFGPDDLQRARPYLFNKLMEHIDADGMFDTEVMSSGEVLRYFSLIPEEEGLRRFEMERVNKIIDKTIDAGLMAEDYTWRRTTTKTQIALWVDLITRELAIPHKWKWAEQRWQIKNLKQAFCNSQNQHQYVIDEELVLACFE